MTLVKIDGVDVYYEVHGKGDPVLLIHGAAVSGRWFGDFPARLGETHRVIVPDLRGLGRSGRIEALTSPRNWVDDMWRILDAEGVDDVELIGVSLGSRIAGRMALEQPQRVRTLTVDAPIIGVSAHGNAALNTTFTVVDENSAQAKEWLMLHGPDWRVAVDFYGKARNAPGVQDYLTLRDELAEISMPTLICRGDFDDTVHPIADSLYWHSKTPHSELFIAPGCTQSCVILERPDDFLRTYLAFLKRAPALRVA
jgi:pimeloyl-ACP methyl ester carboxylesterase